MLRSAQNGSQAFQPIPYYYRKADEFVLVKNIQTVQRDSETGIDI